MYQSVQFKMGHAYTNNKLDKNCVALREWKPRYIYICPSQLFQGPSKGRNID